MQRILITGANGFVGKILCETLQDAGHHVIALVGNTSPAPSHADHLLQCDIRNAEALEQAIAEADPTHVVHLAAITHVPTSFKEPLLTWETNVMGSVNLLQALQNKAPKAFVLFVSSSEVYGGSFKQAIPLNESSPCQPLNPYAASKLAAEAAVNEYFRQGQPGIIVRPFNHIGAQQSPDFATASFARQIALVEAGEQPPLLKVGNLQAERDFLDVRDVCNAYVALLQLADRDGDYPRCFNICSGQPRKIQTMLDMLLAMSSKDIEVGEDPQRMRPSDIPSAVGDNSAIRNAIGWQPGIDLQETLATLLDYWRAEVKEAR
ncbi:GDP-6-deoxy-D-lyxo-4-hexulose reductase [Pseudomonas cichorii]|uniref:GDP-mannose 4,6-dehydratase n=1 Tax=Pseudomonas cichorii TaxID=36746 RepID=UPI00191039B4|nr:GDP-mannose 4,6-dehydratase [Pseudomonas cichorii]GFM88306.1 GDP-6-deoxy-D-lyxo-4-hexulose reductase [Pseudomonas cichorii]